MKHIKLSYKEIPEYDIIVARIEEQTHIGKEFGVIDLAFYADNGMTLISDNKPLFHDKTNCLFCRGVKETYDNDLIYIPKNRWKNVKKAIEDYNEVFSDNKTNRNTATSLKYVG